MCIRIPNWICWLHISKGFALLIWPRTVFRFDEACFTLGDVSTHHDFPIVQMGLDICLILGRSWIRCLWPFRIPNSCMNKTNVFFHQFLDIVPPNFVGRTVFTDWFGRTKSSLENYNPVRYVQISFYTFQFTLPLQQIPIIPWVPKQSPSVSFMHNFNSEIVFNSQSFQ